MNKKGTLVVISGFSGAGKGTLVKRLLEKYDNYSLSVSATTRQPREGEEEGVSYFFKSVESFEDMIEKDEFIEYAKYVNNYYGTPKSFVEQQLDSGKDVILEIEIQGALKVKDKFPETLLLFITPPDAHTLKQRLIGRGTETLEVIENRLARAAEESMGIEKYDFIVVNDDLEECVDEVHQVIQSSHNLVTSNHLLINQIREELTIFTKGE